MVVRQRRKKNKLRGQRTHGAGNTKNRRGSGCKGGVGRAGSHKHKFSIYWKEFGKHSKLLPKTEKNAMNLEEFLANIPEWIAEKKIVKTPWGFEIDGKTVCVEKILGRGNVNAKIALKNIDVSKHAKEKILSAGGTIEKVEKKEKLKEAKNEEKPKGQKAEAKTAEKHSAKESGKKESQNEAEKKEMKKEAVQAHREIPKTEIQKPSAAAKPKNLDSETEIFGRKLEK